jgi:hypothetical protein
MTKNHLREKVILIQKDGFGFMSDYQMRFNVYYLLTPQFISYAFLEDKTLKCLESGIYDIVGLKGNLCGKSGFIIRNAEQIKKINYKNKYKKPYINVNKYSWPFKITLYSKYKLFTNWLKRIKSNILLFLKKSFLIILSIIIILGGIYGFYQLVELIIKLLSQLKI